VSRWRVAARLARREIRRHWARSILVVAIIALPVLAAQAAAIAWQSLRVPPRVDDGTWKPEPAAAGADDMMGFDPRLPLDPRPDVARTDTGFRINDWVRARPGRGTGPDDLAAVQLVAHVAAGPDPDGSPGSDLTLVDGALPTGRRQVVLSEATADATGLAVGDTLTAEASRVDLEVVGVAEEADDRSVGWVGPPVDGDDWVPDTVVRLRESGSPLVTAELFALYWYPPGSTAMAVDPAVEEPVYGPPSESRLARVDRSDVEAVVTGTAVATMIVGFVAITCSSAFAIGARRQLRQLGTLSAAGARPGDLLRAVLLQGTVLGLVGSAVATAAVYAGRSFVVRKLVSTGGEWLFFTGDDGDRWVVARAPGWVLAAAAMGVVAGTAAALVPAVTASRIPVLSALAGRRPGRRRRARSPLVGLAALAVGLVLLSWSSAEPLGTESRGVYVVIAVLLTMGGGVALAPAAAEAVAALAARAGGTARLAGRGLVRNSMRTGAVVATTAVAIALPVVVLVGRTAGEEVDTRPAAERRHEEAVEDAGREVGQVSIGDRGPGRAIAVDRALDAIGRDVVRAEQIFVTRDGTAAGAWVVDPDELRRIAGDDLVADALERGDVVAPAIDGTGYSIGAPGGGPIEPLDLNGRRIRTVAADQVSPIAALLLDQAQVGLIAGPVPEGDPGPSRGVVSLLRPGPFTSAERTALYSIQDEAPVPTAAALRDLAPSPNLDTTSIDVHWVGGEEVPWTRWFVLGAALFALVVIGTAMALAASDGRGDDAVVAAVGAPPGAVRRRRVLEATMTAAAAAVLALVVGVTAALVVVHNPGVHQAGPRLPLRLPVLDLLGTAGGIVAVVGLATWLVLAIGARVRGRRDLVLGDG
jgi:putative ABC transport system permease protein